MAEDPQQREVVEDLEKPTDDERPGLLAGRNRAPAIAGLAAAARLRGTEVTLAAAARSGGVTTAIT